MNFKKLALISSTVLVLGSAPIAGMANPELASKPQANQSSKTVQVNKQIVGSFLGAVMQQDTNKMRKVANRNYIQHNPFVPTGLEPFIQMLPVLKQHGTYAENVRMFADGDYVFYA